MATVVGVRAPSLYSYFPSKSAIYDEMFADGNRALLQRLRKVPNNGEHRESLLAGVGASSVSASPIRSATNCCSSGHPRF